LSEGIGKKGERHNLINSKGRREGTWGASAYCFRGVRSAGGKEGGGRANSLVGEGGRGKKRRKEPPFFCRKGGTVRVPLKKGDMLSFS